MKKPLILWTVLLATLAVVGATGGWSARGSDPSPANSRADELPAAPRRHDAVRLLNPYERPKNGPPLTNVFHKAKLSWLQTKLKDPTFHPSARMPDFEFTDEEVLDVMAYLESIKEELPKLPIQWPAWAEKGFEELKDEELDAMFELTDRGQGVWGIARCTICHNINGPGDELIGGFVDLRVGGIDLQIAGTKLKRDWLYRWVKDPKGHFPDTLMPRFRFSDEEATALVEYLLRNPAFLPLDEPEPDDPQPGDPQHRKPLEGSQRDDAEKRGKRLIEMSRCVVCHEIEGIAEVFRLPERQPIPPEGGAEYLVYDRRCLSCHTIGGRGGTYAPDLTGVGSRLHEAWMAKFLEQPDIIRPLSEQMPKLNLEAEEAKTLASYLSTSRRDASIDGVSFALVGTSRRDAGTDDVSSAHFSPEPEEVQRGGKDFEARGCRSCHTVGEAAGGVVGPDLANVGDRLKPEYLWYHLKNPHAVNPYSAEPDFGFSDEDARDLAAYLSSRRVESEESRVESGEAEEALSAPLSTLSPPLSTSNSPLPTLHSPFINRRQQVRGAGLTTSAGLYRHYCAHCHGKEGQGDGRLWATELSPGPADLTVSKLDQGELVKFITEGSSALDRPSSFSHSERPDEHFPQEKRPSSSPCPPWGQTLSEPDVQRLAGYLVSLRGAAESSPPPESHFAGPPFPTVLLGVILAEIGMLVWIVLRKKRGASHVVPEDSGAS